jgi:hypothetical protein
MTKAPATISMPCVARDSILMTVRWAFSPPAGTRTEAACASAQEPAGGRPCDPDGTKGISGGGRQWAPLPPVPRSDEVD